MLTRWLASAYRSHPRAWTFGAVVVVAAAIRVVFLAAYGARAVGDAAFYIDSAARLLARGPAALPELSPISAPLYPVFLALLAGHLRLDLVTAAVAGQVVLGALTAGLVVSIAYRLDRSPLAAPLAGAIAGTEISFVFWGVYVLTETLLIFVLALTVDRLLAALRSRRPIVDGPIAVACLLLLLLARPTAAAFAMAVPIWAWIAASGPRARWIRAAAAAAFAASALFMIASMTGVAGAIGDRVGTFLWGALWVGLQWTEQGRATGGVDLVREPPGGVFRDGVTEWLRADPGHFFLQALRKLRIFWTPVLPEFSLFHSVVALAYYLPLYGLALVGIRRLLSADRAALALPLLGIASFTLLSMVTFVDYDQRYRLPAELLLAPLAGIGGAPMAVGVARWIGRRTPTVRDARIDGRSMRR